MNEEDKVSRIEPIQTDARRFSNRRGVMTQPVKIEIAGLVKLDDEADGLLVDAFENSRLSCPGNSTPLKLNLDPTQAHDLAVHLEEQGFGYGAFWCQPPSIREALWILWYAIRGTEMRTEETLSMKPWAVVDEEVDHEPRLPA